jgi:hypothetical protein
LAPNWNQERPVSVLPVMPDEVSLRAWRNGYPADRFLHRYTTKLLKLIHIVLRLITQG